MRKIFLSTLALFFVVAVFGQKDTIPPPYKRFPSFPPVKLLLPDSASYFTKDQLDRKKATMVMVFSPQCDHCKHETEELIRHIDEFDNIQIIMSTSMPFDSMMSFREKYKLADYKNIIVGQDIQYFFFSHYMLRNLPFLAFYNKKKELISVFEGGMPMKTILEIFKESKD
jgi:hypothetical protein